CRIHIVWWLPAPGITTGKDTLFERLDHLTQNLPRQELLLIKGGASGADALGSEWAEDRSIARASFPAFWKDLDSPRAIVKTGRYGAYNARAGMDRNARRRPVPPCSPLSRPGRISHPVRKI
ncbi:SLOG family protein, partial [Thiolapillus sp.]